MRRLPLLLFMTLTSALMGVNANEAADSVVIASDGAVEAAVTESAAAAAVAAVAAEMVAAEAADTVAAPASDGASAAPVAPVLSTGDSTAYVPHHGMDWRMFKSVTNPATRPYKFLEDQTWVGVPLFFAGLIAKSEKTAFRQDYNNPNTRIRLIKYNFHTEIDNYTQYVPLALTLGLHLGGYEGRSDWPRFWASSAMSAAIMAGLVNGIKYTASEMRPDGSTRNAWPSGHTATAFLAATILHKEYGMTRSPWFSVGAYTLATATGVMRVLNNRHWISDVLSGAGIGILSVELGYGLCDLLFKGRGLLRNDLIAYPDLTKNPSFFSISMGAGFGNKHLDLPAFDFNVPEDLIDESGITDTGDELHLKFRTAMAVGAEAAWFFCPYVGIGGRLRVKSTPINGWSAFAVSEETAFKQFMADPDMQNSVRAIEFTIESDHITEFAGDLGVFFSLPLSKRFALGTKLLVGRSIMDDIEVSASYTGDELVFDYEGYEAGTSEDLFKKSGKEVSGKWDYINVSASNSMKLGSGLSVTYAHKNSFAFRLFCDYDYSRKTFTATYNPFGFIKTLSPDLIDVLKQETGWDMSVPAKSRVKKSLHQWVLGGALSIHF